MRRISPCDDNINRIDKKRLLIFRRTKNISSYLLRKHVIKYLC